MRNTLSIILLCSLLALFLVACSSQDIEAPVEQTSANSAVQKVQPIAVDAENNSAEAVNKVSKTTIPTISQEGDEGLTTDDSDAVTLSSVVVDTGQTSCYDDTQAVVCPEKGETYYGQDAQYVGVQPSYVDNGDGTVTDLNTGLMWHQTPDLENKSTYPGAVAGADTFALAGYDDWRLPTIKELYSLMDFSGRTGRTAAASVPFIDTDYFDFEYGNESAGERFIDAQYWTSTEYVGATYNGDATVFGVNFADGRIKGYPRDTGPGGRPKTNFVRYVRGNPDYGVNNFVENGDGAITDLATGLMWQTSDSGVSLNWEEALAYAENLEFAGYDDWRLPNAKELQSIVDYTRAPAALEAAQRGPAIDPIFDISETESWFWTGTTHVDGPFANKAVYLAFGQANGVYSGNLIDVHGAGAQRSDPKSGDPADYADGFGPQNDERRIFNYVRAVRGGEPEIFTGGEVDSGTDSNYWPQPGDAQQQGPPHAGAQQQRPAQPGGAGQQIQPGGAQQQRPPQPGNTGRRQGGPPNAGSPQQQGPPQEAIYACVGLSENASCEFTTPFGTEIKGTCAIVQADLACIPQGQPRPSS